MPTPSYIRSDRVDADVLDAAPHLRIVVRAGAGVDNVDLERRHETVMSL